MPSWPLDQVLPLAIALPLVGIAAGLIAGLLGVGGGIVIVPVLYHVFTVLGLDEAIRMHVAVGTSLATIIATSTSSWRSHARKGAVDRDLLRSWGPFILVGVAIGSLAAGWVKGPVLTGIFAGFALLVSLHMAFGRPEWRLGHSLPTGAAKAGLAALIGGCSAMMGIGGGTFAVPTLTLFGTPIHRAVGTASAIGLIIGIPGTIGFILTGWNAAQLPPFSLGYVNLLGVAAILPTSMAAAPWGARLAHSLDTRLLRRAFAVFLFLTSLRMAYGLLN
ncbi:conserved membrane protein of unknown function [Magnetospirillum gryphiswaldense MSR-1 v2]|uniref:Probable membrane transporter protein n=1 Tax=Magnetospirillum gryphiswaldense (strain DSM 6361 / JCM 21280 / NBRC 15271 / MSR-1) TaxID=431944 RepID=V6F6L3_MAGGM|nr:sulfite exporter TauE/SafE family protein [Magnetospirillum gryphiswaldense]CDK99941.1 conserved membrane protein of unknown function [Magnetospirillum gryphiswaldense MSR-1 v2]